MERSLGLPGAVRHRRSDPVAGNIKFPAGLIRPSQPGLAASPLERSVHTHLGEDIEQLPEIIGLDPLITHELRRNLHFAIGILEYLRRLRGVLCSSEIGAGAELKNIDGPPGAKVARDGEA